MLMQSGSFFFGLWGLWLHSASIFSEEVSGCKWKLSIGFIYPLFFSFSLHISCYFSSAFRSKHPSPFSPFCCLLSLLSFTSFPPSLCSALSFSVFLCLISILSLSPPSLPVCFLPLPCLVFFVLCSRRRYANRTVNLHGNAEFAIAFCTASRYCWNGSDLFPPRTDVSSTASSSLLHSPLHLKSCRRQAAVG